ncbi:MAG: efflux RND transporter permease subunit [Snowella sp.]|nr:efflux RND transporter permease subunit [Snowella sp.]
MQQSIRNRYNLSRWAINHPWLTISFWIAIAVAGLLAFSSLKYALFPEVTFPVVIVNATAPLESAQATESQLTQVLEQKLIPLAQTTLYSSTYAGRSVVSVAFDAGLNLENSTKTVESALKSVKLPQGANIDIFPFNLNESSAVTYAIAAPTQSLEDLRKLANEKIIPELNKLPRVLRVNLLGDADFREVANRQTPEANPPTLVRFNGEDVLAVQVIKKGQANTLDVVRAAQKAIDRLQAQFPDVKLILAETQARYIQEATLATIEALLGAIVLAVLVIFPFLRSWRATLIAAIAIPLSLLGTFIVMAILGFNLETLTLLALALVIGIVVDDAIVDVENISRHIEQGESPRQAAIHATEEIGLTVSASTLTIVAVFLPIALMGGTLGQFFKPFAVTVATAVIVSLLVARTLSPVLAVFWLRPQRHADTPTPLLEQYLEKLTQTYRRVLQWSLGHRAAVMGIAIASFIIGLALIPFIPQGFIPVLDRGEFNVVYTSAVPNLADKFQTDPRSTATPTETGGAFGWMSDLSQSPEGFFLRRTRRVGEKLEPTLLERPETQSVFSIAGVQGNPLKGKMYVQLKPERDVSTSQIQTQLRETLPKLPKVSTSVEDILFVETGDDSPLKLTLTSNNPQVLEKSAENLKSQVEKLPGLIQVKLTGMTANGDGIEHFQGERAVYLSANLAPDYALGEMTEQATAIAKSLLPKEVKLQLQGDSARLGQVFTEFSVTLLLSLGGMLLIFLGIFKRLLEPLVIALSLPLCIVGAMLGLLLTQSDFGMISLIGLIFLLGLLDKNAILLIDYANQLRSRGLSRHEALIETGTVRLRPIIMTTASTILGMLPLALGLGAGAELRQPMAVAIIGGLLTSSLLSLIVVPVLYSLLEDVWAKRRLKSS